MIKYKYDFYISLCGSHPIQFSVIKKNTRQACNTFSRGFSLTLLHMGPVAHDLCPSSVPNIPLLPLCGSQHMFWQAELASFFLSLSLLLEFLTRNHGCLSQISKKKGPTVACVGWPVAARTGHPTVACIGRPAVAGGSRRAANTGSCTAAHIGWLAAVLARWPDSGSRRAFAASRAWRPGSSSMLRPG